MQQKILTVAALVAGSNAFMNLANQAIAELDKANVTEVTDSIITEVAEPDVSGAIDTAEVITGLEALELDTASQVVANENEAAPASDAMTDVILDAVNAVQDTAKSILDAAINVGEIRNEEVPEENAEPTLKLEGKYCNEFSTDFIATNNAQECSAWTKTQDGCSEYFIWNDNNSCYCCTNQTTALTDVADNIHYTLYSTKSDNNSNDNNNESSEQIESSNEAAETSENASDIEGDTDATAMPELTIDANVEVVANEENSFGAGIANAINEAIDLLGDPISAAMDLAAEAQSTAAQALYKYTNGVWEDSKLAADYQNMTDDEKALFDKEYELQEAEADAFHYYDREITGYHEMDDTRKIIYDEGMLKWVKKVTQDCATSETGPGCLFAETVREAESEARVESGYYSLLEEERTSWDEKRAYENAALVAAQTQQWHVTNVPVYGTIGSACSKDKACFMGHHCCGTFTRFDDESIQLNGRCHSQAEAYTDDLGFEWTHQCGAAKLLAAAAALLASAYLI